jgi:hypothetical protein
VTALLLLWLLLCTAPRSTAGPLPVCCCGLCRCCRRGDAFLRGCRACCCSACRATCRLCSCGRGCCCCRRCRGRGRRVAPCAAARRCRRRLAALRAQRHLNLHVLQLSLRPAAAAALRLAWLWVCSCCCGCWRCGCRGYRGCLVCICGCCTTAGGPWLRHGRVRGRGARASCGRLCLTSSSSSARRPAAAAASRRL